MRSGLLEVQVTACTTDEDCGADRICEDVWCITCPCPGQCEDIVEEPDCRTDDECGEGEVCEPSGPGCAEPMGVTGCHIDDDCGEEQYCLEVACFTCPCPGMCSERL